MTWTPLGPSLLIYPRYNSYTRLARANGLGYQCAVFSIAVHPSDEHNIVVVTRRVGGSSAFRTTDDGHSWSAIADGLTRANPQLDLTCAAVHPQLPDVVYLGAGRGQRVFVSTDGGLTWPQQRNPGGRVTQLIVDRNSGGDWHTATIYAATDAGVAHSINGGDTWTLAEIGEVTSLVVYMPTSGPRKFYAGVYGRGLYYAESPDGPWQNLFGMATGLPAAPSSGSNMVVLVDYCPRQPDRVYAMVANLSGDHFSPLLPRLYVSVAAPPGGAWEERGAGAQPQLDFYIEGIALMVAPEPVGADTGDVLLCSSTTRPRRSTDGGRTWAYAEIQSIHHVDVRCLAHYPPKTAYYPDALSSGATPTRARVYVGSDGGLGTSRRYTDPTFDIATPTPSSTNFNAGATYDSSLGLVENLNHGLTSVAAHQFASSAEPLAGGPMSMLGYLTTLDTGTSRRIGSTAWRFRAGGDAGSIFVAQTTDGVRVWVNASEDILWPTWNFVTWKDRDLDNREEFDHVLTTAAYSCGATSNMMAGPTTIFYVGIIAVEEVTTLLSPCTPGSDVEVVPNTMTPDFVVGARVCLGDPVDSTVYQPITSVSTDRFHVTIYGSGTYPAATAVRVVRCYVARVTGTLATRVSQVFIPQTRRIYRLAKAGDALLAASADQRLWMTASASTANEATVWTEVSGRPSDLSSVSLDDPDNVTAGQFVSGLDLQGTTPLITSVVGDAGGTFYVMLSRAIAASIGGTTVNTPLFRVEGGAWVAEHCTLPDGAAIPLGVTMGKVVSHPTQDGRLFVARNARVFQLDRGTTEWAWTDLTDNLPGQEIHDLWIGNIAVEGAEPRFLLRAVTAVRGVWEMEIGAHAITGALLYFRDHSFDPGWTRPSADGVLSPLRVGQRHWHWQSADIKVDTPLRDSSGSLYYQNEPEAAVPTAGDFAWFKDRSQSASAGTTARVWVRVNNRSTEPSGTVNVWAITCQFSGALPALPSTFWSRFDSAGNIDASSPISSEWTSLGVRPVSAVHAEAPGIVEFEMPTGAEDDHRCIVAFVHGPGALLDTAGLNLVIDEVVPAHSQIAQRNVLVGPPLPSTPGTPPPPSRPGSDTGPDGTGALEFRQYMEFHNPWPEARAMTIRFDLGGLPPSMALEFRLSSNARPQSVTGAQVAQTRAGCLGGPMALWRKVCVWLRAMLGLATMQGRRLPLADASYLTRGGEEGEARDMLLPPGGKVAAELRLRFDGPLEPGAQYHLDVLQLMKRSVVGGATIILPVASEESNRGERAQWEMEREVAGMVEALRERG
jgi:hypothetical protein